MQGIAGELQADVAAVSDAQAQYNALRAQYTQLQAAYESLLGSKPAAAAAANGGGGEEQSGAGSGSGGGGRLSGGDAKSEVARLHQSVLDLTQRCEALKLQNQALRNASG